MSKASRAVALAFSLGLITATAAFAAARQSSPQTHLNAALASLQDAQKHLAEVKPGTGMHTQATVTATNSAVMHVKEAIAAGEEK